MHPSQYKTRSRREEKQLFRGVIILFLLAIAVSLMIVGGLLN